MNVGFNLNQNRVRLALPDGGTGPGRQEGVGWAQSETMYAMAESFFKMMKKEMVYHHKFATIAEAKLAVFEYIEGWCNRKRRHSALGCLIPCQYEDLLYYKAVAA